MATSLEEQSAAAHWGIDPVPQEHRRFSGFDLAILWGDLGIGLLVIITGMFLVAAPEAGGFGMSLPAAAVTIVLGSLIGCLLLAAGGLIGTRHGRPTMALFRPVLGRRGSWIPSTLNAAQLLGWTAFELWAMSLVANELGQEVFGFSSNATWLVLFSVIVLGLSLWGPLGVVRIWLERFGAWVTIGIGAILTIYLVSNASLGQLWRPGGAGGGLIVGLPLDLVIVMPVSWLPLVADYNRFAKSQKGSFIGTFGGYFVANVWFYVIGGLIVTTLDAGASPGAVAAAILGIGGITLTGTLLLAGLLVGETDEAFADVYSGAVSLRNIFPSVDSRILVTIVTIAGALLAGSLTMANYETFLFFLGSIFVPLLAVWFADHFVLKRSPDDEPEFRWTSLVGWVAGFLVYHWIVPTSPFDPGWLQSVKSSLFGSGLATKASWLNGSIPALAVAFSLHVLVQRVASKENGGT